MFNTRSDARDRGFDHRVRQHSFAEIGHEIISTITDSHSSRAVVSYWRKDVHLVLVNALEACPGLVWLD